MFRNPVYDLIVVVPALLITALVGFFVMTTSAHAETIDAATSTGSRAITASTSGTTLPDPSQRSVIITRDTFDADTSAPVNALAVRTSSQLETYARAALAKDPYIASITLSSSGITVAYRRAGYLLGLVPVPLPTTATVRPDGNVLFEDPWYGSVTLSAKDHMKTALEVRVHSLLSTEGYLDSMQLAPATQAEILDIIRELLA